MNEEYRKLCTVDPTGVGSSSAGADGASEKRFSLNVKGAWTMVMT